MRFTYDRTGTEVAVDASKAESAEDGVDALYREHGLGLVRFALMLAGDQQTAEDVVQEAFLGLYRNWGQVRVSKAGGCGSAGPATCPQARGRSG